MFQDNDACCRICRSGKNPNMAHIGRTHRISIAWLYEQLQNHNVNMYRADSEFMAADIFTKTFPDCKAHVWSTNLGLINIYDKAASDSIEYHPELVRSMRGDLDKDKAVHIDQATLTEEDDAKPALPCCARHDDDRSTTCPNDDDRNTSNFDEYGDDTFNNDEWTPAQLADASSDYPSTSLWASSSPGMFADCEAHYGDPSACPLLAAARERILKLPMDDISMFLALFPMMRNTRKPVSDCWEIINEPNQTWSTLVRHHVVPRTRLYKISKSDEIADLPDGVNRADINDHRKTQVYFAGPYGSEIIADDWTDRRCASRSMRHKWTGRTEFLLNKSIVNPVPQQHEQLHAAQHDQIASRHCVPRLFKAPDSWTPYNRVLVEFCTYPDGELCKSTPSSEGCYSLRCTISHDMTNKESVDDLLRFINSVPQHIMVCVWSGIPCTGGSPSQNMNRKNPGFAARIASLYRTWHMLFDAFFVPMNL